MTTPTPALTTTAPDGAYTIGGGEWNYGQNMTEEIGKSLFMLPDLTPENIGTVLRLALERLPIDALKAFQPVLGLAEDVFLSVGSAVTAIIDSLIVRPAALLVTAFNQWVEDSFNWLKNIVDNLVKVLKGIVPDFIEEGIQDVIDFITDIQENSQNAIEDVTTVVHGVNETIWGLTGNDAVSVGPSGVAWAIKHVGAQSVTDNINISGWFEEDLVKRSLLGGCTGGYELSSIHYGSLPTGRSYRVNMTTTANGGLFILPLSTSTATFNDGVSGFPVSAGQTYRMSAKVWFPASNVSSPGAYIGVRTYDGAGNYDAATVGLTGYQKGSWISLEGTYTVPDNYQYEMMYPFVGYNASATAGDKMYVDSVSIVPETNTSITDAISVGSGFPAGATPAAAASRLGAVRSTAQLGATGAATANSNLQVTWDKLSDGLNNTTGASGQTPTSVGSQAATVRQTASGAAGNVQLTWNNLYDGLNGSSGSTGRTASDVQTVADAVRSKAVGVTDAVATGLGGIGGTGLNTIAVQTAADDTRNNIATLQNKVNQLTAQAASGAFSGNAISVDFTTYSNSTSLGALWAQGYNANGSGLWGISSGRTYWYLSGDSGRTCIARYNGTVKETVTDMQRVTAVFSTGFQGVGGALAENYIFGRMNSSGTAYVYVRFRNQSGSTQIQFGYQGGLLGTVLTRNAKAGASYMLECGTGASGLAQRTFNLYENGTLIHQYIDSGYVTTVGLLGAGIGATASSSGSATPCQVSAFGLYDNAPPSYKGSAFRACNFTSTGQAISATTAPFPLNYFVNSGTNTWATSDYSFTGGTAGVANTYNRVTVSKEGWYLVNLVQGTTGSGSGTGGTSGLVLYKNGAIHSKGPRTNYPASTNATGASMQVMVYLLAGDYVQPGYESSWAHSLWNGDASGLTTYFQVNFLGNTMPT